MITPDVITNEQALEHADTPVVKALLSIVMARLSLGATPAGYKYCCLEHWVLQHGVYFPSSSVVSADVMEDFGLELGEPKQCFANAYEAIGDSLLNDDLGYVEGYALSLIPFHHAWITLSELEQPNLAELTIRLDGSRSLPAPDYFGVPFAEEFVLSTVEQKGTYGVLDNWEQGYPLLKDDSLLGQAIHPDWRD